jgi:hypothetical protein
MLVETTVLGENEGWLTWENINPRNGISGGWIESVLPYFKAKFPTVPQERILGWLKDVTVVDPINPEKSEGWTATALFTWLFHKCVEHQEMFQAETPEEGLEASR